MRLSSTEPQLNRNKSISFSGNETKYVSGKYFSRFKDMSGTKQRAALGVAALVFQPAIDYANPMADEKTRKFSVLKTVVKAVVGTLTGIAIRGSIMRLTEKQLANPAKFLSKIKSPELKQKMQKILADKDESKKFIANIGTVFGLIGVAVGDFTFDMPLARWGIQSVAEATGMSNNEKKEAV